MPNMWLGPGLVLLFAISQALRDVYFAGVFQGVNFFVVVLIAFSMSIVVCGVRAIVRNRSELKRIHSELRAFIWMNITTAIAWSCYFFALKTLQPSIVNTLHSAIAPLTVVVLGVFGMSIVGKSATNRTERFCYFGLAASIVALWWVTLSGRSGLVSSDPVTLLAALASLLVSGTAITISLLLSKRMNDRGFGADAITVGRYPLITLVALIALLSSHHSIGITSTSQLITIALAAALLIGLPLYVLQVGIANTAPLTGHVIRSLGPVFVFALELVDQRITYSVPTLACVVLYCAFSIGANIARGWRRA